MPGVDRFYGNLKALCDHWPKDTIGVSHSYLKNLNISEDKPFNNGKCIIRRGLIVTSEKKQKKIAALNVFLAIFESLHCSRHIAKVFFVSFDGNVEVFNNWRITDLLSARALVMRYVPFCGRILHIKPSVEYIVVYSVKVLPQPPSDKRK